MKKALTVKLGILAVILVLLIGLLIAALLGKGSWLDLIRIGGGSISYDERGYSIIDGEALIRENISVLEVNYISGRVNLVAYDGDTVVITESCSEDMEEDDKARFKVEDGKLTVQFRKSGGFGFGIIKTMEKTITIKYPKRYTCKEVGVNIVSADLSMTDFSASDCSVENVFGSISISGARFEKIKTVSVSGDVEIDAESVVSIDAESVSGNVSVNCKFDNLDGESVSGAFRIKAAKLSGARIELDAVSGKVRGSVSIQSKGDVHTFGDESTRINVDTVSGDVIFE